MIEILIGTICLFAVLDIAVIFFWLNKLQNKLHNLELDYEIKTRVQETELKNLTTILKKIEDLLEKN